MVLVLGIGTVCLFGWAIRKPLDDRLPRKSIFGTIGHQQLLHVGRSMVLGLVHGMGLLRRDLACRQG